MSLHQARSQESPYLELLFTNSTADLNFSNTYLNIFNDQGGVGFVNGGSLTQTNGGVFTDTISLADAMANGGLSITNLSGGQIWISYGSPLTNLATSPGNGLPVSGDAATTQYQYFEVTRASNNTGGQGDMTAINQFTAPISITTYSSYTNFDNTTQLQHAGFNPGVTANQLYASLQQAMGGNSSTAYATGGNPLRVYGPSTSANGTVYPNSPTFASYITSVAQQFGTGSNFATFVNNTAAGTYFNTNSYATNGFAANTTNTLQSYWQMTGVVTSSNSILVTGSITISNTIAGQPIPINPYTNFSGLTVEFSGTNAAQQTWNLIAAPGTSPGVTNAGIALNASWTNYYGWLVSNGLMDINAPTNGLNPFYGLQSQVIGEVGMGFAAGFVGSTNTNSSYGGGTVALGQLLSTNWWALPNAAFANAQTNTNNYDQYAGVIAQYSSNSVYGAPYSDRFGTNGPLLQSVQLGSTNVNTWIVDLGAPLSGVPEPSVYFLFGLGILAVVIVYRRRVS